MAVNPYPEIYSTGSTGAITAIDFGTGDAGTYEDSEAGTEYQVWNDKGGLLGSAKMTSVKLTVRDLDGLEVDNITTQHWVEAKSTTIHEGAASTGGSSGDASAETDDNMSSFQPIGEDNYLAVGDIPSNCYRKVLVRVHIPTNAIQESTPFNLYVTNQQPSSPISKWITGVHGNGIIPTTGDPFAMTSGTTGSVPYAPGTALINNNEVYYGSSGGYSFTTTGTYYINLSESGVIGSSTEYAIAGQTPLYQATFSSGICTVLVDKRIYLVKVQAGTTSAIPPNPTIPGSLFLDKTNSKLLKANTTTGYEGFKLDSFATPSTGLDLNATTDRHGLLIALSGSTDAYLRADGTWVIPSAGGDVYSSGFAPNKLLQVSATEGTIKPSVVTITTGDVIDFGAHSAGFTEQTIATTTGTANIDWNAGNSALYTRSSDGAGAVTFTFTNPVKSMHLQLLVKGSTLGSTGTVAFPKIYWSTGYPTFSTAVAGLDSVNFYYSTGLAEYLGMSANSFSTV